MLKGWWTYAVVLIAMLGALSACNSGDGDDDVVEARRYDFVTYLGYADGLAVSLNHDNFESKHPH